MHIPDGFLDGKTAVLTAALSLASLGLAIAHTRKRLPARRVPLLGLSAAFVFAAQMINFPVYGGTSGHLVGAVLVAALLGPGAAIIVLSAVLIVQALVFADGGILALGANVFNMALLGSVGGWLIYDGTRRLIEKTLRPATPLFAPLTACAFAGWCSTVLAAVACAGELASSGTVPWSKVFPAMAGVHMLIGIGEGAITAVVLAATWNARPELLAPSSQTTSDSSPFPLLAYGAIIALGIALFVTPFASPLPDGLDKTAQVLGFEHQAIDARLLPTPLANYQLRGISSITLATSIAGAVGTLIAFGLSWLLAHLLVRRPAVAELSRPSPDQE